MRTMFQARQWLGRRCTWRVPARGVRPAVDARRLATRQPEFSFVPCRVQC